MLSAITISYITNKFLNIILPWGINTLLVAGLFFFIGYLLKENNLIKRHSTMKQIIIITILLIIGLLSCLLNPQTVSYIDYEYGYLTLAILSGMSLSLVFIYISEMISKNKVLEYIDRKSVV